MPSNELQEATDVFATEFVEAVDIIRTNIHQLPFLILGEQPSRATEDALYIKHEDASLFFNHYKAEDDEVQRLQKKEKELENQLKVVRDKLASHLAQRKMLGKAARRKLRESQKIAKEYDVRRRKEEALERRRNEATEKNLELEFQLRLFVKKAEKALAKAKW